MSGKRIYMRKRLTTREVRPGHPEQVSHRRRLVTMLVYLIRGTDLADW